MAGGEPRMTGDHWLPEESIHRCVPTHSHLSSYLYVLVAPLDNIQSSFSKYHYLNKFTASSLIMLWISFPTRSCISRNQMGKKRAWSPDIAVPIIIDCQIHLWHFQLAGVGAASAITLGLNPSTADSIDQVTTADVHSRECVATHLPLRCESWQTKKANWVNDNDNKKEVESGNRFPTSNWPWNQTPSTPGPSEESGCVSRKRTSTETHAIEWIPEKSWQRSKTETSK